MRFCLLFLFSLMIAAGVRLPVYAQPVVYNCAVSEDSYENGKNTFKDLKVPTQITKLGNRYFITDTYHNQVIYSENASAPLKEWKKMSTDFNGPHAIASDGENYLVVDTENNRVCVFKWLKGRFQRTQIIEKVGRRPHYIYYDPQTARFMIWSSLTGEMYYAKTDDQTQEIALDGIKQIPELDGQYVRSFSLLGDTLLFPSGSNEYVILADADTFEVLGRYPVPRTISGMAYGTQIGNYFYFSVSSDADYDQSKSCFIRVHSLEDLQTGQYELLNKSFPGLGIAYYIDRIDGMFYLTSAGSGKQIWRYNIDSNDYIMNVSSLM